MLDINVGRLSVDMLTLNAAKIYGPKQVGLLWVRPGVSLKTHVHGGGQELGIRSGTENVAGVIGFAEAIRLADKRRKGESKRLSHLQFEAFGLIFGVVQLGIAVCQFAADNEQFETFGQTLFGIGSACQRGNFDRVIDDLCRSEERRVGKECRSRWSPYH